MVADPIIIGGPAEAADPLVHIAFSGEHGYPLDVFPQGFADDHPLGEGNERDDLWLCAKCEHPEYSDNEPIICPECGWMAFRKAHRYILIECRRSQVAELWQEQQSEQRFEREGDTDIWRMIDSVTQQEVRLFVPGLLTAPPPVLATRRIPIRKLDLDAHRGQRTKVAGAKSANVYNVGSMILKAGGPIEFAAETRTLDTFRNAILTVGDGKTYATIQVGGVTNASSGDVVQVFAGGAANVYTEAVNFSTKALQLLGMVDDHGITITNSSGVVIQATAANSYLYNFTVTGTGTATLCADIRAGSVGDSLVGSGGTTAVFQHFDSRSVNCVAHSGVSGFIHSVFRALIEHGSAISNSGDGFLASNVSRMFLTLCLGSDNGGEDFDTGVGFTAANVKLNVSEDGTAPGGGSVTSFVHANLENFFHIKAANAGDTLAKFNGFSQAVRDALRQTRGGTTGVVYAGAHTPAAVGGVPDMSLELHS